MESAGNQTSAAGEGRDRALIAAARRSAGAARERSRAGGSTGSSGGHPLPAGDAIPGCDLVRRLQSGGQGVVYQAIQRSTGRTVAVKLLREGFL